MSEVTTATKTQLVRQVAHWTTAAERLQNLEDLASSAAWNNLERYLGLSIRQHLNQVIKRLNSEAVTLRTIMGTASTTAELSEVRNRLLAFRAFYLRVEPTLDFFTDAINTRTSPRIAGLLRACDTLAHRSIAQLLDPLGHTTPVALTYLDKGLGASILKAGLRLWDGTSVSPVAAIKITRHNLYRPTALIHEAGHQAAHIVGWNQELASALSSRLAQASNGVATVWASWASEIAADTFAFAHTGYASVAALHDVVDGGSAMVFRYTRGDPHPVGFLRVLLGIEMCRQFYGAGPWDDLAQAWTHHYPYPKAPSSIASLIQTSLPLLPEVVRIALHQPMAAFDQKPLAALINPERVKPKTLLALEQQLGAALYTSMHWVWTEALRLLALTGLRMATMPELKAETVKQQEDWMLRLGGALQAA